MSDSSPPADERPPSFSAASPKEQSRAMAEAVIGSLLDRLTAEAERRGGSLNVDDIRAIDGDVTQDQYRKGVEEAKEVIAKYEGEDQWEQFVFNNNNLGNKLGGLLYLKVDQKRCKLRITDNYMTIYDGKKVEDSNPVGTNYFLRNEEALFWEHCTDSGDLIATKSSDFPKNEKEALTCAPPRCDFTTSDKVTYHYVGQDGRTPKDGCTYTFDSWLNWKPLQSNVAAEIVDWKQGRRKVKEIRYPLSKTFTTPGMQVMEIVRYASCEGKPKEQVEVACNLVLVR